MYITKSIYIAVLLYRVATEDQRTKSYLSKSKKTDFFLLSRISVCISIYVLFNWLHSKRMSSNVLFSIKVLSMTKKRYYLLKIAENAADMMHLLYFGEGIKSLYFHHMINYLASKEDSSLYPGKSYGMVLSRSFSFFK